ncbi:hypothetical protein [Coleofasciculus sp. F4-SAH-05]|uniref:hypothetical protein n=1 Tax=Coleofasciculus sp. F4-SAH-05 TaxID=3069525 RepID=UPI0032F9D637
MSLVIGHSSLVIGHLSFVIGHSSLVICHWSLVIGNASVGATRLHKLTTLVHSIGSGRPLLKLRLHKRVSPVQKKLPHSLFWHGGLRGVKIKATKFKVLQEKKFHLKLTQIR